MDAPPPSRLDALRQAARRIERQRQREERRRATEARRASRDAVKREQARAANKTDARETWRPAYEMPGYEVSDLGRVLTPWGNVAQQRVRYGVLSVRWRHGGEKMPRYAAVGRLVLRSFGFERPLGAVCQHRDGDTLNCALSNLTWGGGGPRSPTPKYEQICTELGKGRTHRAIAAELGVDRATVLRHAKRAREEGRAVPPARAVVRTEMAARGAP
jgi:hypothetical protein